MKSMEEALTILLSSFPKTMEETETVPVDKAVGRVLAKAVHAKISSPAFHLAAMDGIAVRAEETFGASETRPRDLVTGSKAYPVNTGHVMPDGTDAVIMIENVVDLGVGVVRIEAPAFPFQHVRKMGEDIVATELLFPHGHRITPSCTGAMISGGVFSAEVLKKPKAVIIPTGSELADFKDDGLLPLKPGKVIDSNSYVLKGFVEQCGAEAERYGALADDRELISNTLDLVTKDRRCDMVLLVGGSSAGSEDFTRAAIAGRGEILVHGVTMMPGKPLVIGTVNGKPVFGIPGYPVSAIMAFDQFVAPLIHAMLGIPQVHRREIDVVPTRNIHSKIGLTEFVRVKIGKVGERMVATPLSGGAGAITSFTEADGLIRIPSLSEGIKSFESVRAEILKPLPIIENTVVIVGSHDNTLDVLSDEIRSVKNHGGITLSSSHVGSLGGLMALKKGFCHLAGSHLLDESDGSYNLSYIRKHLPEKPVKVVNLVLRDQGLIIPKGNPKGIVGLADLVRDDLRFINRQKGSGTRILLDFKLRELGIDHKRIDGYGIDEYTHMSVAAAVLSGAADVGLGIYAAARALDLDFIPVVTEQYDLVLDETYFHTRNIQILCETVNSKAFRARVQALGGYDTSKTGSVIL
jgi:putative molybdopterin biosynthesis protein